MIYKFRIITNENREFAREMLISSKQTFLDFHQCLQGNLGYDPNQLASFFITNTAWEKELQITLIDMMDDESDNCTTMEKAVMEAHLSEKGDRMLYVFDFFSERSFFIELTDILNLSEYKLLPKIVFEDGAPPQQISLSMDDDIPLLNEELDNDLLNGFSDDDLAEGFDFIDSEELPDE
ncbi:MAG: plasmid pRiA4b ORF-3 family protein [Bacteroidales bacterium]|nr:plasmid pRiA4b ORF-3 family protein [Bacteroidales bacterium]